MYILIALLYIIQTIFAQDGGFCTTPNREAGRCMNLPQCNQLVAAIKLQGYNQQLLNYLSRATCGYNGRTPLICCADTKSAGRTEPTTTTTLVTTTTTTTTTTTPKSVNVNSDYVLLPPQCGRSNDSNSRVVGGVPAKLGEFPWLVALGYKNRQNARMPKWLCGGSLITNRHILTAAHCVYNRPDLYTARLGDLDLYDEEDGAQPLTIPLIKAKVHENFSPSNYVNDIAILTLKFAPESSTIWPVCLPIGDVPSTNNDYTVAGWGALKFKGPSSSLLQKAFLPEVELSVCKNSFRNFPTIIDDRVLCVGYLTGGIDTCQGDSGGPLMRGYDNENNQRIYYQYGVVSYGFKCAEPGYPGVYTRVANFIDWIQANTQQ